ncbi:MAG: hypothetical protein IPL53_16540 [Ignavibacteria bacterium]|nr:hypothetical protein [Ignavibacteria bacterium]
MKKYKIIELLRTFSKNDIKRFNEFLNSPFFNNSEKLIKTYKSLIAFYPEFNSVKLTEERIFSGVSPGSPFKKPTLLNLFSDLFTAAERYLAIINFEEKNFEKNDFLREELLKRNLSSILEANIKKQDAQLDGMLNFDSQYYKYKWRLTNDKLNYHLTSKPRSGAPALNHYSAILSERSKFISSFFVTQIIKDYTNFLSFRKSFNVDESRNFVFKLFGTLDFEKLIGLLITHTTNERSSKIFRLYLAMYLSFSRFDDEVYYFNYKKLLFSDLKELDTDEIRFHTIQLLRYCMEKSGKEKKEIQFDAERFDIYNLILSNQYYKASLSSYMPVELYRTVFLHGLKLKKYTWTFEFIKKYRSKLHPDKRDTIYNYSCSEYYFRRGRYTEAMKSFKKIKLDHFMLKVDMRNLMLRTYFELGLYDNALSLIDSYKHFLSNDTTLSSNEKRINKNFVNVIYKMIIYRTTGKLSGKFKIQNDLKREFPFKEWVMEKFSMPDHKYNKSA